MPALPGLVDYSAWRQFMCQFMDAATASAAMRNWQATSGSTHPPPSAPGVERPPHAPPLAPACHSAAIRRRSSNGGRSRGSVGFPDAAGAGQQQPLEGRGSRRASAAGGEPGGGARSRRGGAHKDEPPLGQPLTLLDEFKANKGQRWGRRGGAMHARPSEWGGPSFLPEVASL